jgi:microcystin-dependent protein
LLCNGAVVSRNTYADLFSVIGTTWGAGDADQYPFTGTTIPTTGSAVIWFYTSGEAPIWYQTVGTKFTVTGGSPGLSTYTYTITGYGGATIYTTAVDAYGFPVTSFIAGTYMQNGYMTIITPQLFNVPDTGNKTIRGINNVTVLPNDQGGSDSTNITISANNLPQHTHTTGGSNGNGALLYSSSGSGLGEIGNFVAGGSVLLRTDISGTRLNDGSTAVANSAIPVTTTNPYIAIPYIIKYA